MKKWLETSRSVEQHKRLGMLLAQCWKAEINVDELSKTNIGKLVRELKKYPDSDVRTASNEVLKKWKQVVEDDEMKKVNASKKVAATDASKHASVPKPSSSLSTSKPQTSAPITSKVEKKNAVVSRAKTARTKNTAFRKTGELFLYFYCFYIFIVVNFLYL